MRSAVVLALAATAAAAHAPPSDDPLATWLYALNLTLPDYEGVVDGFDVALSRGVCSEFIVSGLHGSGAAGPARVNASIDGLGLECDLEWSYREQSFPHLHGSGKVKATISEATAAGGVVVSGDGARAFPAAAALETCAAAVDARHIKLKFTGTIAAPLLDALGVFAKAALAPGIGDAVCGPRRGVKVGSFRDAGDDARD